MPAPRFQREFSSWEEILGFASPNPMNRTNPSKGYQTIVNEVKRSGGWTYFDPPGSYYYVVLNGPFTGTYEMGRRKLRWLPSFTVPRPTITGDRKNYNTAMKKLIRAVNPYVEAWNSFQPIFDKKSSESASMDWTLPQRKIARETTIFLIRSLFPDEKWTRDLESKSFYILTDTLVSFTGDNKPSYTWPDQEQEVLQEEKLESQGYYSKLFIGINSWVRFITNSIAWKKVEQDRKLRSKMEVMSVKIRSASETAEFMRQSAISPKYDLAPFYLIEPIDLSKMKMKMRDALRLLYGGNKDERSMSKLMLDNNISFLSVEELIHDVMMEITDEKEYFLHSDVKNYLHRRYGTGNSTDYGISFDESHNKWGSSIEKAIDKIDEIKNKMKPYLLPHENSPVFRAYVIGQASGDPNFLEKLKESPYRWLLFAQDFEIPGRTSERVRFAKLIASTWSVAKAYAAMAGIQGPVGNRFISTKEEAKLVRAYSGKKFLVPRPMDQRGRTVIDIQLAKLAKDFKLKPDKVESIYRTRTEEEIQRAIDALSMAGRLRAYLAETVEGRRVIDAWDHKNFNAMIRYHGMLAQMEREIRLSDDHRDPEASKIWHAIAADVPCPSGVTPLVTEEDFRKEGEEMDHCVYGYFYKSGIFCFSFKAKDGTRATLEWRVEFKGKILKSGTDDQFRGIGNAKPSSQCFKLLDQFIHMNREFSPDLLKKMENAIRKMKEINRSRPREGDE